MKYGITLPNAGLGADLHVIADLAQAAEQSGWDGVFLWDSLEPTHDIAPDPDHVSLADTHDPWITMAAIASTTDRIRFGPMITPVARRRPWKLARECVSIDHLSGGRLSLSVGLGYAPEGGFAKVGEETDIRIRAERLDEGLAILDGLWSGESFSFEGNHFAVKDLRFRPRPLQQPRIPIWVVAGWRSERSIARALRWDGVIPQRLGGDDPLTPAEIAELTTYARAHRAANGRFEVVVEGLTTGRAPSELERVQAYADAGVTWWLEGLWLYIYETPGDAEVIRRWIGAGPPRPTQA